MAATGELLLQAIRAACRQAFGLTAAQVIPAQATGPRPVAPYLTVRVGTVDIPEHSTLEVVSAELTRVTVETAPEGTVYTITVDGDDFDVTRAVDDTNADVAGALASAIWATYAVDTDTVAVVDGADVLLHPGAGGSLTVTVSAHLVATTADAVELSRGGYSAVATIQGFGDAAASWVEGLEAALQRADVVDVQNAAGIDLSCSGGVTNVAALLDAVGFEPRWSREVEASYTSVHLALSAAAGAPPVVVAVPTLLLVDVDVTAQGAGVDAIQADFHPLEAS